MNWTAKRSPTNCLKISELDNPVGKAGSTESVLIVAIIWGIAILL